MIVVDTNLLAYLYVRGEFSGLADGAFLRDSDWRAPWLWRSELRSVLAACLRKKVLSLETAVDIMEEAERLMSGGEYEVPSRDVLYLAAGSRRSAYDCEFVALARELGARLVTMDEGILADFPDIAVRLDHFANGGAP